MIRDFLVEVGRGPGSPVAGDDAADAAWFTPAELDALETSPGLVEALEGWGLLPRGIPIIDLGRLRGSDPEAETARLRSALHETGFLYVTGHGVPPAVVDGVFAAAREFFALPLEDRLAIDKVNSPQFRGYTRSATSSRRAGPTSATSSTSAPSARRSSSVRTTRRTCG